MRLCKDAFFEGLGVEIVYLHLRKTHEFLGMQVCLPLCVTMSSKIHKWSNTLKIMRRI